MRTLLAIIFYTYSSLTSAEEDITITILLEAEFKIVAAVDSRIVLQRGKDAFVCLYGKEYSKCFRLK